MSPRPALVASNLRPCYHQVGGHMKNDAEPESYVDEEGRFFKPYTDGPRAEREIRFYESVFPATPDGAPRPHADYPAPEGSPVPHPDSKEPRLQDIEGLRPFVPQFYGTLKHEGRNLIGLEDLCRPFKKPNVIDCKLGYTTVYDWADDRYKTKFTVKDAETTQNSLGVRVSGLQVWRASEGTVFKPERDWARKLTDETIGSAFQLFASGDHIKAKELYAHPEHGILHKLSGFKAWMESQCSYQFFQSSVLIVYEGEATRIEDANVRVAWVDFAHTFQTVGGARDENVLRGLNSLLAMMEAAAKA